VLDLIRDEPVGRALEILQFSERDPAIVIGKCLASAVANAEHNDALPADELFVSACYADEGPTLKRWRPRARGRATRIRKRTCHITVIVSRFSDDQMAAIRRRDDAKAASSGGRSRTRDAAASRRRRVARSRGEDVATEAKATDAEAADEVIEDEVPTDAVDETTTTDETTAEEAAVDEAVAEDGTDDTAADEQLVDEAEADADADDATEEQD
jgi:large subunit ribosomal protein L22